MRLQASNVPDWTIGQAVQKMHSLGIPVKQSTLVRAAIAAFIGLDDSKIREIAIRQADRKQAELSLERLVREDASGRIPA